MRTVEKNDEGLAVPGGVELPSDWQQLARENGGLRAIVAELLITNQKLRWELGRERGLSI
jgi:hypothetical protein